jgi:hypothetical protein
MGTKHGLTPEQRFWTKVKKSEACWLWTGVTTLTTVGGHGRLRVGNTMVATHRLSWVFAYGPVPHGLNVLHKCGVPACVRPDHLYLGTQRENTRDSITAGTYHRWVGQSHPRAKLTDEDVRIIRARHAKGERGVDIIRDYGVTPALIYQILRGEVWKHID